jgi:hypothetical protein
MKTTTVVSQRGRVLLARAALFGVFVVWAAVARAEPKSVVFNEAVATYAWTLSEIAPALPSDWTGYEFLVVEFRASSSQRFEIGLKTAQAHISKRIHPYPGVWVRAAIPLRFYRQGFGNANSLAAMVNQPRDSYWINIEGGGFGPTTDVRGLSVTMRYPVGAPRLELRSVTLAKSDPGDAVLEGKPLIDAFGQYIHADWPGKAHTEADLKVAWAAESAALAHDGFADRCPYGGFAHTKAKATGFFRVEKVDGQWWFVCPDGHLFYSAGVNGIDTSMGTRVTGREDLFAVLPPAVPPPPGATGRFGAGQVNFYGANLQRRYGVDWRAAWAQLTAQRLEAWGLNTSYGTELADALANTPHNKPYVMTIRGWQSGPVIMGMPDVYSDAFVQTVDQAARQLVARKGDPYLLGYFIGNEPPWPGRESQFVDLVLASDASALQQHFRTELAKGDTPERRRELVLAAFARYLGVINAAVKRHDPNHLNLGIRFGGAPPDYVVALAKDFDVYSMNKYRWDPPTDQLTMVAALTGRPILLGEFHIGVPGRGMAPGLVQAMNQTERGQAYRFYVEHAAANPNVVGTHWFQWIDQPATGRPDGENYNIGWIDVTDRPYAELVAAGKLTHARLFDLHRGKVAPTDQMPRASEVGTPPEAYQFGLPGIQ